MLVQLLKVTFHLKSETNKLLTYQAAIEGLTPEEAVDKAIREWCINSMYFRTPIGLKRFPSLIETVVSTRCQR